jgi:hypothetical protein
MCRAIIRVMTPRVFSLNVHASWRCRHTGACCRAGWTIPVEAHARWITGSEWLEPDARGICPQFDETSSLCRIHHVHGESLLPQSCHHFPRRALTDARGTFVTLSHYCPTAASLLVDHDRLDLVTNPEAFPIERGYEGLDARGEWPPLLRPNALFDHESFSAWERHLIETFGSSDEDVDAVLARIAATAERLRAWSIAEGELAAWTRRTLLNSEPGDDAGVRRYAGYSGPEAFDRVCETVPAGLTRPTRPPSLTGEEGVRFNHEWRRLASVGLRYLGAKAFASWTAYQSTGIRTQVAELYVAAAVLRAECLRQWTAGPGALDRAALIEAVRGADWLLVHLADRSALVAWLREVES